MRVRKMPLILSGFLAACASVQTVETSDGTTRNGAYFLDYEYVRTAMNQGNAAFDYLVASDQDMARSMFRRSEETLREGLIIHADLAKSESENQQDALDVLSAGMIAGLSVLGYNAAKDSQSPEATQNIFDAVGQGHDTLLNLQFFLHEQLAFDPDDLANSNARDVDEDVWRTAVISNDPIVESIVLIRNRTTGGYCTGFFIQPNVIATSAHCYHQGDRYEAYKKVPEDGKRFLTGDDEYYPVERTRWLTAYDNDVAAARSNGASPKTCTPDHDIALMITKRESAAYLDIDPGPVRKGEELVLIGHSGDLDRGYFLRLDAGCTVTGTQARTFTSNCSSAGGNSGGPVIALRPDATGTKRHAVAVATHSCGIGATDQTARKNVATHTAISQAESIYNGLRKDDLVAGSAPDLF